MSKVGTPRHDAVPIGEIAEPPFARLPDPSSLFQARADRFQELAAQHELAPFLLFLSGISSCQHRLQDGLPDVDLPADDERERAREHAMPPLDRGRFTTDAAFDATLGRLLQLAEGIAMPETARAALARVTAADAAARIAMARAVLANEIPVADVRRPCLRGGGAAGSLCAAGIGAGAEKTGAGRRRRVPGLRRRAGFFHGGRLARRAQFAVLRLLVVRDAVELCADQMHAVRFDQGHCLSARSKAATARSRLRPASRATAM